LPSFIIRAILFVKEERMTASEYFLLSVTASSFGLA
jgi:hypothetical protein